LPISRQGEPEGGPDRYMDLYIAAVRRDVLAGTVQMIGHPTFLPGIRGGLHDQLWTPERRRSFVEAVAQSGVALEISTRYNVPAPLLSVPALDLGESGVSAWNAQGERILDVHHKDHPASRNVRGSNGISIGFTAHYDALRARFGTHLEDGLAGENILVQTDRT